MPKDEDAEVRLSPAPPTSEAPRRQATASAEPDVASDSGIRGGVDEPNEADDALCEPIEPAKPEKDSGT
jgi:hypothetical protein